MFQEILPYIFFVIGFVALIKGADLLIDGASAIAKRLRISNLVIGLTIVAFGTSAPELLVNVVAGLNGSADLAVGNVVGSNISNILLILGVAGLIYPLRIGHGTVWKEIPFALLGIIVIFLVANDALIEGVGFSTLTRIDGLMMLGFFAIFIYYTYGIARVQGEEDTDGIKRQSMLKASIYVAIGCLGLGFGSNWVVDGAIHIAQTFGLSESLIGLTIVAIGTSLPELVTAIVAAMKKHPDLAIGNVVGSNIFNSFFVLGVTSTMTPLAFSPSLNIDIAICVIATIMLFFAVFVGRKHQIERWQSAIFLSFYVGYIVYLVMRG
jgi:cation:H+ antiporter